MLLLINNPKLILLAIDLDYERQNFVKTFDSEQKKDHT